MSIYNFDGAHKYEPKLSLLLKKAKVNKREYLEVNFDSENYVSFSIESNSSRSYIQLREFNRAFDSFETLSDFVKKQLNGLKKYIDSVEALIYLQKNASNEKEAKTGALFVDYWGWNWFEINKDLMIAISQDGKNFMAEYSPEFAFSIDRRIFTGMELDYAKSFTQFPEYGVFRKETSSSALHSLIKRDYLTFYPKRPMTTSLLNKIEAVLGPEK